MPQIAYALAGEGRGHATRARTVADGLLKRGAEIVFITGGDALAYLGDLYRDNPRVRFIEIPVLRFGYSKKGHGQKVSLHRTAKSVLSYTLRMTKEIDRIAGELKKLAFTPQILIADYEPLASRMSARLGIPLVTLDSQHYFAHARLKYLPKKLWAYSLLVKLTCWWMAPRKHVAIISKFVPAEFIRESEDVYSVGPLIRPELISTAASEQSDLILCYLRPSVADDVIDALRDHAAPVRVYGLGARLREGSVEFCEVSAAAFARDLLACRAVIGTAGSQLTTECLYLRKRFWAYPEPGQMEQEINAELARQLGVAVARKPIAENLRRFLAERAEPNYPPMQNGNERAADILMQLASQNAPAAAPGSGALQESASFSDSVTGSTAPPRNR